MNLTPRLEVVAKHVKQDAIVADIGTDHAYIPIYLVENNISKKIIASDVNKGPIEIAKNQINRFGYSQYIETRWGSGLEVLKPKEVDTVIISGMGGILIREILENQSDVAKSVDKLILQPMIAQDKLREYLINNGFKIIDEDLAKEEDRIYQIIIAKPGFQEKQKEVFYEISSILFEKRHPLLKQLITKKEKELSKVIESCKNKNTSNSINKLIECKKKLEEIQEVKDAYQVSTDDTINRRTSS